MKCPTGAPVRLAGRSTPAIAPSWRTSKPSVRCEWITPLGFRVVPEVKPMTAGESGSVGSGASIGSASSSSAKWRARPGSGLVLGTDHEPRRVGAVAEQRLVGRQVVGLPEAGRGHDDVGLHDVEDVAHLLRPVEVHDRHDDRAELRGAPEGDRRLDPVRQLEHDDVARSDAPGLERRGERSGRPVDLAEGAAPRPDLRVDDELGIGQPRRPRRPPWRRASRRSTSPRRCTGRPARWGRCGGPRRRVPPVMAFGPCRFAAARCPRPPDPTARRVDDPQRWHRPRQEES